MTEGRLLRLAPYAARVRAALKDGDPFAEVEDVPLGMLIDLVVVCARLWDEADTDAATAQDELVALRARLSTLPADVVGAWRVQKTRALRAETKVAELREINAAQQEKLAAFGRNQRGKK